MESLVTKAKLVGMQPVIVTFNGQLLNRVHNRGARREADKAFAVELNNRAFVLGTWLPIDNYILERSVVYKALTWDDLLQRNGLDYLQQALDRSITSCTP